MTDKKVIEMLSRTIARYEKQWDYINRYLLTGFLDESLTRQKIIEIISKSQKVAQ